MNTETTTELLPARYPLDVTNAMPEQLTNMPVKADAKPMTPQQARVSEVSDALAPAYQKASTLELTEAEIAALTASFPDECVEIRPHDGLIYIPHILISDRLNKIFKPGKWSLICRRHWLENDVMYGEYVLLVRGCFVGESVGGHPYQSNNPKVNYSDTLESTAAEALRRICGKRLSCGSQVWHPEYAREWCAKHATKVGNKWERRFTDPQAPRPRRETGMSPEEQQKAQAVGDLEKRLLRVGLKQSELVDYARYENWLEVGQLIKDFSLPRLHWLLTNFDTVAANIDKWKQAGGYSDDQIQGAEVDLETEAKLPPADIESDQRDLSDIARAAEQRMEQALKKTQAADGDITGEVTATTKKPTKKAGSFRYGIKVGETWVNSFDKKHFDVAEANKGSLVRAEYKETQYGKDVVSIQAV